MYYVVTVLNALDGLMAIGISTSLSIAMCASLIKLVFYKWTTHLAWWKIALITTAVVVSIILVGMVVGSTQMFTTYGNSVGLIVDSVFGPSWSPLQAAVGMVLMALPPILINFLLVGSLILANVFFRTTEPTAVKRHTHINSAVWFASLITVPAVTLIALVLTMRAANACNQVIAVRFNQFNAHVKSLCMERSDVSECPQGEQELMAFDPDGYAQLKTCTKSRYHFDKTKEEVVWQVFTPDGGLLISSKQYYPGFGYFHKK